MILGRCLIDGAAREYFLVCLNCQAAQTISADRSPMILSALACVRKNCFSFITPEEFTSKQESPDVSPQRSGLSGSTFSCPIIRQMRRLPFIELRKRITAIGTSRYEKRPSNP